jgi:hypothetical protein
MIAPHKRPRASRITLCNQGGMARRPLTVLIVACALWFAHAAGSAAQSESAATPESSAQPSYEALTQRGIEAYTAGRSHEARALFEAAHALAPSARTLRVLGMTALALDRYNDAQAELSAALTHPALPLEAAQRTEVQQLLTWMHSNLGAVKVECKPSQAEAKVDGKPVARPEMLLEPDEYQLVVTADGFQAHEQRFKLDVAQRLTLRVELIATPRAQTSPPPSAATPDVPPVQGARAALWPWLGGGGVLLAAVGGTLLGFGLHDFATVDDAQDVWLTDVDAARTRGPWLVYGGIGLGAVGVAGIAAALVLWLGERADRDNQQAWSVRGRGETLAVERRF